ncbi:hypothetical protein FQR65_LT16812 [Abscondita terminalis]|nr:hypothetical protein FQR65_LT16812 [Abscondita terminalis]
MAGTTIPCQVSIKEEAQLYSVSNDSMVPPKLSTSFTTTDLNIDDKWKTKVEEEYDTFLKNETEIVPVVNDENLKVEFVDVAIKNEEVVKEEEFEQRSFLKGIHVQEKPFKCNICDYRSRQSVHLKRHMYKHSDEWPFRCDKCDYKCYDKTDMTRHGRTHTREKPFKCNFCDHCCSTLANLKVHLHKHSIERPYSCDQCDYKCRYKTALTPHKRIHTQEKPFKCNFCDYSSKQSQQLKKHLYKHSDERPFSCDKCDYKCHDKISLARHNRTHTQEKPFKCNFCEYSSNRSEQLKKHLYKHSDQWPFRRPDQLKQHLYRHSDDKPFNCDKCVYECRDRTALTRHNKRVHPQEEQFKCNFCDYCSSTSINLKRHLYKHTDDWPFRCEKCDYKTSVKTLLIRHNLSWKVFGHLTRMGEERPTKRIWIAKTTQKRVRRKMGRSDRRRLTKKGSNMERRDENRKRQKRMGKNCESEVKYSKDTLTPYGITLTLSELLSFSIFHRSLLVTSRLMDESSFHIKMIVQSTRLSLTDNTDVLMSGTPHTLVHFAVHIISDNNVMFATDKLRMITPVSTNCVDRYF